MTRHRCYCASCRARDARTFERIIRGNYTEHERRQLAAIVDADIGATVRERINAYTMRERTP